ncbi:MAG: hypothetical protein Q4D61_00510 [Cardiobacteriaceae bacterium]|nr:hypothetical protein [Cardiobacteriaceae bacterium]
MTTHTKDTPSPLSYFTIGEKFFRLSNLASNNIVENDNKTVVTSDNPITPEEYEKQTTWSDLNLSIPILFNFYHGIELFLKGAINIKKNSPNTHKFTDLTNKFEEIFPEEKELSKLIKNITIDIDKNSELFIMSEFLIANKITIDDWYLSLKYPSQRGQIFTHMPLKYRHDVAVPFWKKISSLSEEIISLFSTFTEKHGI